MSEEVKQIQTPEQVAQSVQAPTSTEEQLVEQSPTQDIQALLDQRLKEAVGREQGRLAQVSGQRISAVEKSLNAKLDAFAEQMQPLLEQAKQAERDRLLSLDNEQLAEMVLNQRATAKAPAPQAQQATAETPYLTALATASQELIAENNLGISYDDVRIWEGWQQNMSVTKSIDLARKNIEKLSGKTEQPSQTPAIQQPDVATVTNAVTPSTQGAPQKSARQVSSRSELAELFAEGRIDSSQYRKGKEQLRSSGVVSF